MQPEMATQYIKNNMPNAEVQPAIAEAPVASAAQRPDAEQVATPSPSQKPLDINPVTERERFLAEFLENAATPIGIGTPDGRLPLFNRAFCELVGYSREELEDPQFSWAADLTPPEWNEVEAAALQRALSTRRPVRYEKEYRRKDGSRVPVELFVQPMFAADGTLTHYRTFLTDITDRKRAAQDEHFRTLIDGIPSMLWSARADGHVDYFSKRWLDVAGVTLEEVQGDGWLLPVHPDDRAAARAAWMAACRNDDRFETIYRLRLANGEYRWFLVQAQKTINATDGAAKWYGANTDITERRQATEALRAANELLRAADKRKTNFLAVLSHELRNPLAPIKNSLYILERAAAGSAQAQRAHDVIRRQVDQLTRLVDDLLEITRIDRGKIRLQPGHFELGDLVRRTVEDHHALYEPRGPAVHLQGPPHPIFINADRHRIAQVISNLLQNAIKFTPSHGQVLVSVEQDLSTQQAVVQVADNGVGMAPEMLGRLFQPFTQADDTLDRNKGGLGLGLALVKGLVEQHGGSIVATSDGLGRGSLFTLRLPQDCAAKTG